MADSNLQDPLGRVITLHDHTWYGHIIKGHSEVRAHRRLVEDAIKSPLEIRVSAADPSCRLYYGTGPRAGILLVAVVDLTLFLVRTAYLARKAKGAVEWSR
jgi:hypothetical protein